MSQLLDLSRRVASPLADVYAGEPAASNPFQRAPLIAAQAGASQPRWDQPELHNPELDQASLNQAIVDPSVHSMTQALILSEEHLASALHHIQRMLANTAHLQALVLERTRQLEETQEAANRDDLTGLPNRRILPECLRQTLAHAEQHRQPVALVMLDLNGFRHVNDRFGHAAGDLVLRALARRIAMNLSISDTVCRYGGDEFVLILPDIDRAEAMRTVEKIVQQIAAPCALDGYAISLTASAGVAMYPRDGKDVAELLEAADDAMYRHKPRHGFGRKPSIRLRWFLTAKSEATHLRTTGMRVEERPQDRMGANTEQAGAS